jgi:cytosine/uracil/thiamine/allantoin permease
VCLLVVWGQIITDFGAMISMSAYVYGPVMALWCVDVFIVRKGKLDFRSAYNLEGHTAYDYTKKFNIIGFICLIVGTGVAFVLYDPVNGVIHSKLFYFVTASGASFILTAALYYALYRVPSINRYMLKDRDTVS